MAETQVISKAEDDLAIRHDNDNDSANEGPPGLDDAEPQSGEPAKKRRRVVKPNPDKKFEYFVRQDLCIRHRERHTTHGSQLHKRDTFAQSSSSQQPPAASASRMPVAQATNYAMPAPTLKSPSYDDQPQLGNINPSYPPDAQHSQHVQMSSNTVSPSTASTEPRYHPQTPQTNMAAPEPSIHRTGSNSSSGPSPFQKQEPSSWQSGLRRQSFHGDVGSHNTSFPPPGTTHRHSSPSVPQSPVQQYSSSAVNPGLGGRSHSDSVVTRSNATLNGYGQSADMNTLPYSATSYQNANASRPNDAAFVAAVSHGLATSDGYPYPIMNNHISAIDMNTSYGFPVFGSDDYTQTPFNVAEDFTHWLFNDNNSGSNGFSPPNYFLGQGGHDGQLVTPYFAQSPTLPNSHHNMNNLSNANYNPNQAVHPMSVNSLLGATATSQYIMSEAKRQELLDLMQTQFIERPHDAVKKRKDSVFEGDIDSEGHILSLRMMHTYIGSYWYHQHAQLPILHKPTFSADRTPNLLLLAVVAIGAATLDKAYGTSLTDSAAEFANFVAWHIRWEIIRDADFRPPAKLWVFQTLLLIEIYEKMYATRALHERAHIHHDSTLTLMRRGSSLLGRSASDSPPSLRGEQDSGRLSGPFATSESSRSEESWHRWIVTEATRRAAFGAFVIDSTHATMFGHAAKMVAHEMRLPLPCDEGLWSAVSPSEAGRVQSSLQTNGVKPTMFLEGLKKTLNGQRVRTNSFGRTIIMAGLLSVSWHMTQRDLQISSLGPRTANSFGGPDKWKGVLLRAFDNWKRDFDEALAEAAPAPNSPVPAPAVTLHGMLRPVDDENIFESRTVLHHLAHIAAHVDVVDCQVFAGANRLLGRSITPKDYSVVREKIERWATKASARDAAFYALKFIAQVLVPPDEAIDGISSRLYGHASPILPQAFEQNQYFARDDFLLNRPWVLYISALVVWCYGFALEGPIQPKPLESDFETYAQKEKDMRDYLTRVGGVRAPDDLVGVKGRNRCLGLLMILKESFESTRWELTHEAAGLLGNACMKLHGLEGDRIVGPGSQGARDEFPSRHANGHAHGPPRATYAQERHRGVVPLNGSPTDYKHSSV
ncbi:hypothetical protein B0A52_08162 [Exophiala mesophila]|uniref:Xylanolytic transcriptional activator regulatory domain-containing protein n=1 Tax=Exophiala mesophila TaxID=212818 RepID=A0A438MXF8_EXOME|nr:hypothetical protein B0A52_08162 [Exophiala mesophila]